MAFTEKGKMFLIKIMLIEIVNVISTNENPIFYPIYRSSTYRICSANMTPLFITVETHVVCS